MQGFSFLYSQVIAPSSAESTFLRMPPNNSRPIPCELLWRLLSDSSSTSRSDHVSSSTSTLSVRQKSYLIVSAIIIHMA